MLTADLAERDVTFDYGDLLAPELEDPFEYIEVSDFVRVTAWWMTERSEPFYGTVVKVNAALQYALIELERSRMREWHSVDDVQLVLKKKAVSDGDFRTMMTA